MSNFNYSNYPDIPNPCIECTIEMRYFACHDTCKRRKVYKDEITKRVELIKKNREKEIRCRSSYKARQYRPSKVLSKGSK